MFRPQAQFAIFIECLAGSRSQSLVLGKLLTLVLDFVTISFVRGGHRLVLRGYCAEKGIYRSNYDMFDALSHSESYA